MSGRAYRLGRRQPSVDRTRESIVAAARELLAAAPAEAVSVGAVAKRAAVSRITVYNRFGSRAGLLEALAPRHEPPAADPAADPSELLRHRIARSCAAWSTDPALFRNLPASNQPGELEQDRQLAERLAGGDRLRPGCSIKEAQDVIALLTSFDAFDRLHRDGRRSAAAVAEILMRLVSGILA